MVQPQVTFPVTFFCLLPIFFTKLWKTNLKVGTIALVLIGLVIFLESKELANSSWDDAMAF
jgi:hypothetical protein